MNIQRFIPVAIGALSTVVVVLWWFPEFWYSRVSSPGEFIWFQERTEVPGWSFDNIPVSEAAEAVLVADDLFSGEFRARSGDAVVSVFSAKRYLNKENEVGLFSHTPDRCWTAVGWTIEPVVPDHITLRLHGVDLLLERRVFRHGSRMELVYFSALVGGRPLPYRLDHYLASGKNRTRDQDADHEATLGRLAQGRLWGWAWESFVKRTPLAGPQHFIRISTVTESGAVESEDARLQGFLADWLEPTQYVHPGDEG